MENSAEQLINGYIDGTLDEAQSLQFDELYSRDEHFAREADFFIRQKKLLTADKVAEIDITAKVLGRIRMSGVNNHVRAGHRFGLRRFFNTAAIVLMAVALGSVLWIIAKPVKSTSDEPMLLASSDSGVQDRPTLMAMSTPRLLSNANEQRRVESGFYNYNLEFQTKDIVKADRVLGQLLYENNLLNGVTVQRQVGRTVYSIECGAGELAGISEDLASLWTYSDGANLGFSDYSREVSFDVKDITADQLDAIVKSESVSGKIAKAKIATVLNGLPTIPSSDIPMPVAAPASLLSLRPVLAGKKAVEKSATKTGESVVVYVEFLLID